MTIILIIAFVSILAVAFVAGLHHWTPALWLWGRVTTIIVALYDVVMGVARKASQRLF